MTSPLRVRAALLLFSAAVMLDELLLTRVFSATLAYHYAFLAISIALLGTSIGAAAVQVARRRLARQPFDLVLAFLACTASFALPVALCVACNTPFSLRRHDQSFDAAGVVMGTLAVPFALHGAVVAIALESVDGVAATYAADLLGAGVGCAIFAPLFNGLDGPRAIYFASGLAGLAVALVSRRRAVLATGAALVLASVLLLPRGAELVRPKHRFGRPLSDTAIEHWTDLGAVRVGEVQARSRPFGWGLSPFFRPSLPVAQVPVEIDSGALTVVTGFADDGSALTALPYDLTNLVHHARPGARTLILGAGGGRDVLAALAFRDRSVTAVEVNPLVLSLLTDTLAPFAGYLARRPGVKLVRAEARSFLARTDDRYDILQVSLTDTAAATGAGSLAFVESGLYTVEGVRSMLRHLAPGGLVSISRWWYGGASDDPVQGYRLIGLIAQALRERGCADPRSRIFVARTPAAGRSPETGDALVTVIASNEPLGPADVDKLETTTRTLGFGLVASPRDCADDGVEELLDGREPEPIAERHEIRPPRDAWPFFFHTESLGASGPSVVAAGGQNTFNVRASDVLMDALLLSGGFAVVFVLVPLCATADLTTGRPVATSMAFFAIVGFGFMVAEVALTERLTLYLGRPTRALSVALAALLLASGCGSALASRFAARPARGAALAAALIIAVGAFALEPSLGATIGLTKTWRVAIAIAVMAPIGFALGCPLPLAIARAKQRADGWTALYWGVNAVASVVGAVGALELSLVCGITGALLAAAGGYALAAALGAGPDRAGDERVSS